MIPTASAPATADAAVSTPATAIPPQETATPFDAILSLESLAATIATIDFAGAGAGVEVDACLEELTEGAGGDKDDADVDEPADAVASLAFLATLLALPAVPAPPAAGDTAGAGADSSDAAPPADQTAPQTAGQLGAATPSSAIAIPNTAGQPVDGPAADKLLALAGATDAAANATSRTDAGQVIDDASQTQAPVRGAEWFTHAVRHAAVAERNMIVTHARDPRWAEDLGTRVALMVRGGESAASLQLTPVDLGPLEVNITVRDSQATIHFGAAQAETRNLIEASIPRLREMLAAQGFHLMDASVSQGFARQTRTDVPLAQRREGDTEAEAQTTTRIAATGLLDTYA